MAKSPTWFAILCCVFPAFFLADETNASNLRITNEHYHDKDAGKPSATIIATLTVSWDNAWRNTQNHDAVWLFFKLSNAHETRSQRHGNLKQGSFRIVHNYTTDQPDADSWMPSDSKGVFIFPKSACRGNISWRVQVEIDLPTVKNLKTDDLVFVTAHAIEMVHIPQGAFFVGDADTAFQRGAAVFHEFGKKTHFKINSEAAIEVGEKTGMLFYQNNGDAAYRGDARGPIPAEFPKGFLAFYCMKYELTEANYVAFLNAISAYYTSQRANMGNRFYTGKRGGIYLDGTVFKTHSPGRPANFLNFEDQAAFADWAALRPMTELEYEKACRGGQQPVPMDFPWGTATRDKLSRFYDETGQLVLQPPLEEKDLNDSNLELFGASRYWVMDMNRSLWERCVSVGSPKGRQFQGTHGDGDLGGYFGTATNHDWPSGMAEGSGIGYRGGGAYEAGMVGSPEGRVADRSFGAWGEGPRDIAYGFRAVRTVE